MRDVPVTDGWSGHERARLESLLAGETVIVSMNRRRGHPNLIAWARTEGLYVRIDTRSDWANPHEKDDALRGEQLRRYESYLTGRPELLERVPELRGKVLGCWCVPGPCHGQVLKRLAGGVVARPALSREEQAALTEAEAEIESAGSGGLGRTGQALTRIRDLRLYRATYSGFDDYCRQRWGFTRHHANRQIATAGLMANLGRKPEPRLSAVRDLMGELDGEPTPEAIRRWIGLIDDGIAELQAVRRRLEGRLPRPLN
ncbi:DUF4326 domain-containing protein [Herbidospora sp. RD11066]